jgi:hypothetical protein
MIALRYHRRWQAHVSAFSVCADNPPYDNLRRVVQIVIGPFVVELEWRDSKRRKFWTWPPFR